MELSDVNIEMPVKVKGKQVNEVEGSEPYTGRIARSLHPSLVVKEVDTGADGTITMEAVKKQTEDPLDEIDRIKSAAEQEGRGLNFDEEDEIKLLEEKAKIKQEEDGMRYVFSRPTQRLLF